MTPAQRLIAELQATLTEESEALEAQLPDIAVAIRAEAIPAIRRKLVDRFDTIVHRLTTIEIALAR